MRFRLTHRTHYRYAGTASESFMEARLTPITDDRQRVLKRTLTTTPACNLHTYVDYFGNTVETFSIVKRHRELILESEAEVETTPVDPSRTTLEISVSEARMIWRGPKLALFEFLMPSPAVQMSAAVNRLANQFFPPGAAIGASLLQFMAWMKEHFRYASGTTSLETTVATVLKTRTGVCQDFAQLMLAVLRSAEIPARYVTGYIETESQRKAFELKRPPRLIGASESHAWVEVSLPGGFWWPLDPTNHCVAGERHVKVSVGRDFHDSSPTRGVFKGTQTQKLSVAVVMQRL